MSSRSKNKKSVLSEIKSLVQDLSDRDVQLKKDFRLFESFLDNFPIPVSLWTSNLSGEILNKKDRGFFCKECLSLKESFLCDEIGNTIFKSHEKSLDEGTQSFLIEKGEKTFYVTISPSKGDDDVAVGVSGIAWDVSSNSFILNTLIDIKNVTETKSGTLEEINKKATEAIEKSRLFLLSKGGI